jgi:hypothetical protein
MQRGQACGAQEHLPPSHCSELPQLPQFSQLPHPSVVSPHSVPIESQVFGPQHWLW